MSKKDDIKLDVISKIEDDVLDKNLKKRFELLGRKKKSNKKIIPILIAAILGIAILGGSFMLIFMFSGDKKVPIYTGMTVHQENDTHDSLFAFEPNGIASLSIGGIQFLDSNENNKHDKDKDKDKDKFEEKIDEAVEEKYSDTAQDSTDESSLKLGKNDEIYYATANEDIYITIHFDNPDKFEILSFTFNGEKYASYMFEDGSTMENIIIKQNVGEVEGIVEYTIDAIKYVDGTEIKDVKMEGDRTLEVGVYSEKQPLPSVSDKLIGFNDISFSVEITDELGLLEYSNGELFAMLYDGEEIVATQELTFGEKNAVHFEGLKTGETYTYAIVGVYDAFDKQGVAAHILLSEEFSTNTILSFSSMNATNENVSFSLAWNDAFESEKALTSLILYRNGEKVCDIDKELLSVDGLLSNSEYKIVAEYKNGEAVETIEYSFKTEKKAIPQVTLNGAGTTQTSVSFVLSITDTDNVAVIEKIVLLHGNDTPVLAENTSVRRFDNLLSNNEYTIKVTYSYDLNDGNGAKNDVLFITAKTLSYTKPEISISGTAKLDSVDFDVSINDPHSLGELTKLELLRDGKDTIVNASLNTRSFTNLEKPQAYTIEATYTYNLNDGTGNKTITKSFYFVTQSEGLNVSSGVIVGLGSCTDNIVYINMPLLDSFDLSENDQITELHIGGKVRDTKILSYSINKCTKLEKVYVYNGISSIYDGTFSGCSTLQSVTILNGVRSIGEYTFSNCIKLKSVNIPNSVTRIGNGVFDGCTELQNINIPNGVTSIGIGAFRECSGLESIDIPDSVISIDESAFLYCTSLQNLSLPNNLKIISGGIFEGCISLETVTIPNEVTSIGKRAFWGCSNLKRIDIPNNVTIIGESAFDMCIKLESINLPQSITNLGEFAFARCVNLESVSIPQGITSISNCAFYDCEKLDTVTFHSNLNSIGNQAFSGCSLTSINLPSGLLSIGEYAFNHCALTEVNIPDSVQTIGAWAFACNQITSIKLPKNIKVIEAYCFYINPLTDKIVIPEGVTAIKEQAFMPSIHASLSIVLPSTLVEASEQCFGISTKFINSRTINIYVTDLEVLLRDNVMIKTDCVTNLYIENNKVTQVTIPAGVTKIRDYAFYGFTITSVTIPSTVTSIGKYAFYSCDNLTNVVIPESVTSIGAYAFADCELLEKVTVNANVSIIDDGAFNNCVGLKTVYLPSSVIRIRVDAFAKCNNLSKIVFNGTLAQWNAVTKIDDWKTTNKPITVECTDENTTA